MSRHMDRDLRIVHPAPRPNKPVVPNAVLGTLIFIGCEMMLFAGFISAYTISKANVPVWPPVGQPRLPIETTALNSVGLLLSGVLMWYAGRAFAQAPEKAKKPLFAAAALGVLFVLAQGFEWVALLRQGLVVQSSSHAAFFYLIVGIHALHAMGGLTAVLLQGRDLMRGTIDGDAFWATRLFWYFVVLLWPVLYWKVYL
jgi:cytochrome c oxidase subunit III